MQQDVNRYYVVIGVKEGSFVDEYVTTNACAYAGLAKMVEEVLHTDRVDHVVIYLSDEDEYNKYHVPN